MLALSQELLSGGAGEIYYNAYFWIKFQGGQKSLRGVQGGIPYGRKPSYVIVTVQRQGQTWSLKNNARNITAFCPYVMNIGTTILSLSEIVLN